MKRLQRRTILFSALLFFAIVNELRAAGDKEIVRVVMLVLSALSFLGLVVLEYVAQKRRKGLPPESKANREAIIRAVASGGRIRHS
jgi:hypothetical protein